MALFMSICFVSWKHHEHNHLELYNECQVRFNLLMAYYKRLTSGLSGNQAMFVITNDVNYLAIQARILV